MYRGYALIAPMACTGAMWRMLRVGRILICVHTTNKDRLLLSSCTDREVLPVLLGAGRAMWMNAIAQL